MHDVSSIRKRRALTEWITRTAEGRWCSWGEGCSLGVDANVAEVGMGIHVTKNKWVYGKDTDGYLVTRNLNDQRV